MVKAGKNTDLGKRSKRRRDAPPDFKKAMDVQPAADATAGPSSHFGVSFDSADAELDDMFSKGVGALPVWHLAEGIGEP